MYLQFIAFIAILIVFITIFMKYRLLLKGFKTELDYLSQTINETNKKNVPNFTKSRGIDTKKISILKDLNIQKPYIILIVSSACSSCKIALEELKLHNKAGLVDMVGVVISNEVDYQEFINSNSTLFKYTVRSDNYDILQEFKVEFTPSFAIVDQDGKILDIKLTCLAAFKAFNKNEQIRKTA